MTVLATKTVRQGLGEQQGSPFGWRTMPMIEGNAEEVFPMTEARSCSKTIGLGMMGV